jgi:hypothetical protein
VDFGEPVGLIACARELTLRRWSIPADLIVPPRSSDPRFRGLSLWSSHPPVAGDQAAAAPVPVALGAKGAEGVAQVAGQ